MKQIINASPSAQSINVMLLIARVGIAALMLTHGLPKLASLLAGGPVQFPPLFGLSATASLALAVFAEVFCSIFLLIGFGTRLATIPLIITMLVAAFYIHAADPFAKQESSLHYLLGYTILLIAGSGKYSLDYLLQRKRKDNRVTAVNVEDPTLSIYQ